MAGTSMARVDLDLWKVMINGNCFRRMVDTTLSAPAVLVVGPMGAGKSTFIAIQTGAKYEAVREEVDGILKKVYKCVQADNRRPQTSDGYTSKTLNIGLYVAEERYGGYTYLDTAGMNEDRTDDHRVWTQWSLATTFSLLPKIKSVVLMMDFQTLVSQRGHGVRAMAKSLVPITGSGQASKHFYDSMIFLFTNAYDAFGKVEVERIIKIAKAQFEEQKKQFSQRYRSVNPQAITDDPEFAENNALINFLETLSEATGRVYVCFPDTPQESDSQRLAVQKMIHKSKGISKKMLQEIATTRPTGNLQVLQIFAKLLTEPDSRLGDKSYTEILRERADHLQKLVQFKTEHDDTLQAIASDWQSVQREVLSVRRREKDDLFQQKTTAQRSIDRLRSSQSPTVIATEEVKKSYPTSGWWVLCIFGGGWGWGKHSARESLNYSGEWFSKYEITGGDYTKEIQADDPSRGMLTVDFTSTPGVNLNVTVRFYRPEKDTEETKQQVASLERQVEDLTSKIEALQTKVWTLNNADSKERLTELILTDKKALEQAHKQLVDLLDEPATRPTEDFPRAPSHWSFITNLQGVLSVLVQNHMLPSDLAPSTREPIEGFVEAWDQVQKHKKELARDQHNMMDVKENQLSAHQTEDAPPVRPSFRAMARASLETFCPRSMVSEAFLFLELLLRQPVALGLAIFTYAILLKVWPSENLQGVFGNILLALSVYILAYQMCTVGVHKAALTADSVGHQVDSWKGLLERLMKDAGAATGDITQSLGDRLVTAVSNLQGLVRVF